MSLFPSAWLEVALAYSRKWAINQPPFAFSLRKENSTRVGAADDRLNCISLRDRIWQT